MTREKVRERIESAGIIPAVRLHSEEDALFAGITVFRSGIPVIEITMTTPGALDAITRLATMFPDSVVGAGTVTDLDDARRSLDAGASFLTSPGFDAGIAAFAEKKNTTFIPGALTPTEVMAASKTTADFIKVFPCAAVGGPGYIRALKAPFPKTPLIAAGGVSQKTAAEFIRAGAAALGIGEELIPSKAVRERNESWIHELSRRFLVMVREARATRAYAENHANHFHDPGLDSL